MPRTKKTENQVSENKETKEIAEANSDNKAQKVIEESDDKKAKLAKLLEKAKELEKEVKEEKEEDIKKKLLPEEAEKKDTLVLMDDYLKASVHLGTRVVTPDMRKFVYRRRADGLAVFNTSLLDDKIREGIAYLNKFASDRVIIICKREAGWKPVKKFSELTGIKAFTKKYPSGILTNTNLADFMECDLVFICDPWLDKNALLDANRVRVPVLAICDTNNFIAGVTQAIPSNNKSPRALGMILYLLAKNYIEAYKLKRELKIQDFIDDWDNLLPPK